MSVLLFKSSGLGNCLFQVYAQAAGLNVFLIRKTYQLALASNGLLPNSRFKDKLSDPPYKQQVSLADHFLGWAAILGKSIPKKLCLSSCAEQNVPENPTVLNDLSVGSDTRLTYEPCWSIHPRDIKWASLKPKERAIEKMVRSYRSDPSRLLDCCRQVVLVSALTVE